MSQNEIPDISPERSKFEENEKSIEEIGGKSAADLSIEELQRLADAKRENEKIFDDAQDEAGLLNKEKKQETIENKLEEIEAEREKLVQNLEILKQNAASIEKIDASKNELPLKVLSAKMKDTCDNFFAKLQKMDKMEIFAYAIAGSMVAGITLAGINLAGLEDKFHLASYIPDTMKNFEVAHGRSLEDAVRGGVPWFDKPLDRGVWNWMVVTEVGAAVGTGIGIILKKLSSPKFSH